MISIPALSVVIVCGERTPRKRLFLRRNFSKAALVSDEDVTRYILGTEARSDDDVPEELRHTMQIHVLAARLRCGQPAVVDVETPDDPLIESARALAESLYIPSILVRTRTRTPRNQTLESTEARFRDAVVPFTEKGWTHAVEVALDASTVYRVRAEPLRCDQRHRDGVFQIIADVNGHIDELLELLRKLDYAVRFSTLEAYPPDGQTLVVCGNLIGDGPDAHDAFLLVHGLVEQGNAIYVPGPNEEALLQHLRRDRPAPFPWIQTFLDQVDASDVSRDEIRTFLEKLPSHVVLADGQLVVSSHRLPPTMHGRSHRLVRQMATRRWRSSSNNDIDSPASERPTSVHVIGQQPVQHIAWNGNVLAINTQVSRTGRLSAVRFPGFSVTTYQSLDIEPQSATSPPRCSGEPGNSEANHDDPYDEASHDDTVHARQDDLDDDALAIDVQETWDDEASYAQQRRWTSWWNKLSTQCDLWALPHPLAARPSPYALPYSTIAYIPSASIDIASGAIPAVFVLDLRRDSPTAIRTMYAADGQPISASAYHERAVLDTLTTRLDHAGVFAALYSKTLWVIGTYAGPSRPDVDATLLRERQRRAAYRSMQQAQRAVLHRKSALHLPREMTDDVARLPGVQLVLERILLTDHGSALHHDHAWHQAHLVRAVTSSCPARRSPLSRDVPDCHGGTPTSADALSVSIAVRTAPSVPDVLNDSLLASFLRDPTSLVHAHGVQQGYRTLVYV